MAVLLCGLAVACAKPFSPPGGMQDRTPPRLLSTSPAALSVVPQFNNKIVFTFNEVLSERGINDAVVAVSPQPRGKVHVTRKSNRIEVAADGGWARNQIYRVIIQPGVSDRFNNARKEPIELVFSTGPPIQPTAIAGLITDRITGRAALDAAIEAVRRGDSATYTASGDSAGFFALRDVPAGVYDVRAFSDGNHNRRHDASEALSATRQIALGSNDTVPGEFVLLPMDTTPPELRRADVTDSVHITLGFDDAIDSDMGLARSTIVVTRAIDGQVAATTMTIQLKNVQQRMASNARTAQNAQSPGQGVRRDSTVRRPVSRVDSIRADSMRLDSLRQVAAIARAAANANAGSRRTAADTMPLPDRDVVLTLPAPLPPGKYHVTVGGVRNVNGLSGGGTADFDVRPAPVKAPAKAPADTTRRAKTPADTGHVAKTSISTPNGLRVSAGRRDPFIRARPAR